MLSPPPPRCVIPGVLHDSPEWGGGTTEYALEAIKAFANNEEFECPLSDLDKALPMIWVDDLIEVCH